MKKSDRMTASDALLVAINQELEGIRFYRNAADQYDKKELKDAFLLLMREEEKHAEQFQQLKDDLDRDNVKVELFDNPTALASYITELVDYNIFEEEIQDTLNETVFESVSQVLELGIKAEKLAVLFYLGISMFSKSSNTSDIFDRIAAEEMKHIEVLRDLLDSESD